MLLLLVVDDREMRWLASFGRELAFESLFVVGRLGAECAETVAAAGPDKREMCIHCHKPNSSE